MIRTYKLQGDRFDAVYQCSRATMMHTSGDAGWRGYKPTYEIREPFVRAVLNLEVACGIKTQEEANEHLRRYQGT